MNRAKTVKFCGFCLALLVVLLPALATAGSGGNDGSQSRASLLLQAPDGFRQGSATNLDFAQDSLAIAPGALTATYLSPVLQAPLPFNALFSRWQATVPQAAGMGLLLRSGTASQWGPWTAILPSDDLTQESESTVGEMLSVSAADGSHSRFQFALSFSRYAGNPSPSLNWLQFTFVDSTGGPSQEAILASLAAQESAPLAGDGYPKPPVVPRSLWCTDPACNYDDLDYVPVDHLVVHHTVSNNGTTDWLANVRAIWDYHTFGNDWGDIGYNYLIDPNGIIYEGHLGGDDVVGTHAAGANHGSMGVALLGTYSTVEPSAAMLDSLADLLAWKADQKEIDVFDASRLPEAGYNVSWGLPNLMGHRDVKGGLNTSCPGDRAHAWLPWLRQEVAGRIGFVSPNIYFEEWEDGADSPLFSKSAATWHETLPDIGGCGRTRHAYYTYSTTEPGESANWATYQLPVETTGRYELEVYAPYCDTGRAETDGATYVVTDANGSSTVVASHEDGVGTWMSLGEYDFVAGTGGSLFLNDLTTTDDGLGVWFDAVRLRYLAPWAANQQPVAGSWETSLTVAFSWQLYNMPDAQSITLEAATDAGLSAVILSETLPATNGNSHSHTFSQPYPDLYWRVTALAGSGASATSPVTQFGMDNVAPSSSMQGVFKLGEGNYVISWAGSDATSGVAGYNIDMRADGETAWTPLLIGTTALAAPFQSPDAGTVYWFRSQAIDHAGNVEPAHASGDLNTGQALLLDQRLYAPLAAH